MDDLSDLLDSKEQPSAAKRMPPNAGKGRVAGVPNKLTAILRDAIRDAANGAGDAIAEEARNAGKPLKAAGGAPAYMEWLSRAEPRAFATLLGKLLPTQVTGEDGEPVKFERIVREIVPATPPKS